MSSTWTPLAHLSALTFDPGATVRLGDLEVAIFQGADGSYHALDNSCPHAGGPLAEGYVDGNLVGCPWHGWQFDLRTGDCPQMPTCAARTFALRVVDGVLEARL